jgi:hypothetical protein
MKPETKNDLAAMLEAVEKKIVEVDKEMARIRAEQEKAKTEATYLRGVLSINDDAMPLPPVLELSPNVEVQRPAKFRDVIRETVDNSSAPVSISDVVERLKAKGFSEEGTTPLPTRVGNELYKLAVLGEINRASRGYYKTSK